MFQKTVGSYPEIKIDKPRKLFGSMMLDNMGGKNSEMTAVSTYFYNRIVTYERAEISNVFHRIGLEEMKHLEIFARMAMLHGENPRLIGKARNNHMKFWSASYCPYTLDFKTLIQRAIDGEKKAACKYEEQIKKIDDVSTVEVLKRIIIDEYRHIEVFQILLDKNFPHR
ncbi:MAG: ferritin family protein [Bacillota bacterium]|nr:ferritin family protein [Bacillota bacterium]